MAEIFKREETAIAACKVLVEAYRKGEESGSYTEWEDIDMAYELALKVWPDLNPEGANEN